MKFALSVFAITVGVCLIHHVVGFPKARDGTLVISETFPVNKVVTEKGENEKSTRAVHPAEQSSDVIPGRVWCQHDGGEPLEDHVCQRHCLLKGYSYGLCLSNACSCV